MNYYGDEGEGFFIAFTLAFLVVVLAIGWFFIK